MAIFSHVQIPQLISTEMSRCESFVLHAYPWPSMHTVSKSTQYISDPIVLLTFYRVCLGHLACMVVAGNICGNAPY